MRPVRLQLEGFASFRDPTEIDFTEADLFVLFGPTGAGKSTVIDAITFALYGSVSRYENLKLVAPVISQGANEAKVRLDFRSNGDDWTAVRVVRRTSTGGATTKEARLERDGTVEASGADEVTMRAEQVIGLSFDHFTRCVVLPQGAFAEFLHAKPALRQDLLVELLGLDVYRRIAQAANQQAAERENTAALLVEQLEGLSGATESALREARARADALAALRDRLEQEGPELRELATAHENATKACADALARAARLAEVKAPPGIDALGERIEKANQAHEAAGKSLHDAEQKRVAVEQERSALPERAFVDNLLRLYAERRERQKAREQADIEAGTASTQADLARRALSEAGSMLADAEANLQRNRDKHAAFHLAAGLVPGEPCPVCTQTVTTLPSHPAPAHAAAVSQALDAARAALDKARSTAEQANLDAGRSADRAGQLREQLDALEKRIADAMPEADVRATLERIDALDGALTSARKAEDVARNAAASARRAADAAQQEQARARQVHEQTWRELATLALEPPTPAREDLRTDWEVLVAWAHRRAGEERRKAEAGRTDAAAARTELERRINAQGDACAELGVDPGTREPFVVCTRAAATAQAEATRIARDLESARELKKRQSAAKKEGTVARSLGRLLGARRFESWLMHRALHALVTGATPRLRQLSDNAYSLDLNERNEFLVIDHRNADERRPARSLSGGETFLASLALALSLAEHVAEMSAGTAARLDALFLDEGFGTLDPETLDVVATAIEELGARGRMVGLVTHVRDLAERIPVRYEVRKVGSASTIERVA